jgi:hypothetical protein
MEYDIYTHKIEKELRRCSYGGRLLLALHFVEWDGTIWYVNMGI